MDDPTATLKKECDKSGDIHIMGTRRPNVKHIRRIHGEARRNERFERQIRRRGVARLNPILWRPSAARRHMIAMRATKMQSPSHFPLGATRVAERAQVLLRPTGGAWHWSAVTQQSPRCAVSIPPKNALPLPSPNPNTHCWRASSAYRPPWSVANHPSRHLGIAKHSVAKRRKGARCRSLERSDRGRAGRAARQVALFHMLLRVARH